MFYVIDSCCPQAIASGLPECAAVKTEYSFCLKPLSDFAKLYFMIIKKPYFQVPRGDFDKHAGLEPATVTLRE